MKKHYLPLQTPASHRWIFFPASPDVPTSPTVSINYRCSHIGKKNIKNLCCICDQVFTIGHCLTASKSLERPIYNKSYGVHDEHVGSQRSNSDTKIQRLRHYNKMPNFLYLIMCSKFSLIFSHMALGQTSLGANFSL